MYRPAHITSKWKGRTVYWNGKFVHFIFEWKVLPIHGGAKRVRADCEGTLGRGSATTRLLWRRNFRRLVSLKIRSHFEKLLHIGILWKLTCSVMASYCSQEWEFLWGGEWRPPVLLSRQLPMCTWTSFVEPGEPNSSPGISYIAQCSRCQIKVA